MVPHDIQLYRIKKSQIELPLFLSRIQAGFPSPAEDELEKVISLDDVCVAHPASTFLGKISGFSLRDIRIYPGDVAIIDRELVPQHRDLIVCVIDGEFTGKIFHKERNSVVLKAANPSFRPIIIQELTDFRIWGVITFVIQNVKKRSRDWDY